MLSYLFFLIRKKNNPLQKFPDKAEEDYAIIVTAYMDTSNLPNVIHSLLKLNYSNYLIYIVADNCSEIVSLPEDGKIIVLRPEEILASQARSHFYAINHFKRNHKRLTIIDSDNIAVPDYLLELNKYFDAGFNAVQGMRTAKNFDSIYACIDATNELYYLFYDRKILFNIGSSSMLSGSGMAFEVNLYKECMEHDMPKASIDKLRQKKILARRNDILECGWGFDRILQKEIVAKKYRIAFSEGAIVYDQKTSKSDQLVKQRARWNNSWFRFSKFGFTLLGKGITNFNFNQFVFGFVLLRPPLFILLILSFLIMLISIFTSHFFFLIWLGSLLVFVLSFFISLLSSNTDKRIYKSLVYIPVFVFYQLISLSKTRKAGKYSVATEHSYMEEIK
jgi:cellulose synthase/poly-beta-1,6-N-acetylglucosamine synthase-like glycosyltransferase